MQAEILRVFKCTLLRLPMLGHTHRNPELLSLHRNLLRQAVDFTTQELIISLSVDYLHFEKPGELSSLLQI